MGNHEKKNSKKKEIGRDVQDEESEKDNLRKATEN